MSIWRRPEASSDAALLTAVARGDREAYAALYRRYGAVLLGLLLRILRSRTEAEDVLQDVFLQVWRRARDFDETRGRAFVWLATLARNRALDRLDAIASRQRTVADAGAVEGGHVGDPAEVASTAEEARRLARALAELPAVQRNVLLLAYFEGLTQVQIADRLRQPLGTIKSHVRLGLGRLRALLAIRPGRRRSAR